MLVQLLLMDDFLMQLTTTEMPMTTRTTTKTKDGSVDDGGNYFYYSLLPRRRTAESSCCCSSFSQTLLPPPVFGRLCARFPFLLSCKPLLDRRSKLRITNSWDYSFIAFYCKELSLFLGWGKKVGRHVLVVCCFVPPTFYQNQVFSVLCFRC